MIDEVSSLLIDEANSKLLIRDTKKSTFKMNSKRELFQVCPFHISLPTIIKL